MKAIARHQEGISINDYEYILNNDGEIHLFTTEQEAVDFLNEHTNADKDKNDYESEGIYFVDIN